MKLIVGISGASGVEMGFRLLDVLKKMSDVETHLVMTHGAVKTFELETDISIDRVKSTADHFYDVDNLAATISSGSFKIDGMIVIPCSMKTLAGIACGFSENLLLRAADVCLKERRKLILVPRETPLNRIHLQNLLTVHDAGAMIFPPVLTFYNRTKNDAGTISEQIDHLLGKILRQFGIDYDKFKPWTG